MPKNHKICHMLALIQHSFNMMVLGRSIKIFALTLSLHSVIVQLDLVITGWVNPPTVKAVLFIQKLASPETIYKKYTFTTCNKLVLNDPHFVFAYVHTLNFCEEYTCWTFP